MNLRTALAVTLTALLLPGAASSQEKYTIKIKKAGKGTVTVHDRVENGIEQIKITDSAGNVLMEESKKKNGTFVYRAEILEQPDGKRPTKVQRTYEKAIGVENGKERQLGYHGQKVLIERKGLEHWFRYPNGNELALEDVLWLREEFKDVKDENADDLFEKVLMPQKAVAVGEQWKLPLELIVKEFNKEDKVDFDGDKATGFGKLHKVVKRDGRLFGDLEFRIEVPVKGLKEGNQIFPVKEACSLIVAVRMEVCIDGSVSENSGTISFRFQGTVLIPDAINPKAIAEFNINKEVKDKSREVTK